MGGSFAASKDAKKEFLLDLSITNTHATTGKRWLQSIIESYQKETQLEKQKKNRFMMEFITDRLDYLGRDLDSIEKEMVNFQKETKLDTTSSAEINRNILQNAASRRKLAGYACRIHKCQKACRSRSNFMEN